MGWSTRELAEIANTTVNTVRHYHQVGILPEPERAANGYKQYRVPHLVRLLRIRRLVELGIGLAQIAAMDDTGSDAVGQIRALDAELEATIERLRGVRAELAQVLAHRAPAETPQGFAAVSPRLSETQRSLLAVYAVIFDEPTLTAFREVLSRKEPTDEELDRLPATADEATVSDLAARMLPVTRAVHREFPRLADPLATSLVGARAAGLVLGHTLAELYNPAQLRVLQRLDTLLREDPDGSGR